MRTYLVTINRFNTVRWNNEHGELHREEGPAIEFHDGGKQWYFNGNLHREGGPAVEFANGNNHKEWFIHGKAHREDGPAVIGADGAKEWYLEGVELTEEEFNEKTSRCDSLPRTIIIDGKDYVITRRAYGKIHIDPKE